MPSRVRPAAPRRCRSGRLSWWIPEREIHWLAGYEASQPVQVGNAAMEQHQLDVFGEVELAFRREIELGFVACTVHQWTMRRALIEHTVTVWRRPRETRASGKSAAARNNSLIPKPWLGRDGCGIGRSAEEHDLPRRWIPMA